MEVLTPEEAAAYLHISRSKLEDVKRSGALEGTYYRVGKRLLYIKPKLQQWAENGGTKGMII